MRDSEHVSGSRILFSRHIFDGPNQQGILFSGQVVAAEDLIWKVLL
ncbi:MAG: hypothetical protein IT262_03640 [Saprospiraceae bacterium]|nr:hypothetical protein [Saprospiraceae bacterium]